MSNAILWNHLKQFFAIEIPVQAFSGRRYGRPMSRTGVFLKIQATKFNLEDNEITFLMQSDQFGTTQYTVLITEQWRIKNEFVCVSLERLCHW